MGSSYRFTYVVCIQDYPNGKDSARVADAIGRQGVNVWNGHNYALAIVERMGLLEAGGMIRVGPVH